MLDDLFLAALIDIVPKLCGTVLVDISHVILHLDIIIVQTAGFADEMCLQFIPIGKIERA